MDFLGTELRVKCRDLVTQGRGSILGAKPPASCPSWPVLSLPLELGALPGKLLPLLPDPGQLGNFDLRLPGSGGTPGDHQQLRGAGELDKGHTWGWAMQLVHKSPLPSYCVPESQRPMGS
jgi:hypothetical protein